ncbi:MAG: hypothetical protein ABEH86_11185 [Haloarcula sp.]
MSYEVERPDRRSSVSTDVMCAVDEIDGQKHFVIADIAQDEVWVSMASAETCSLDAWR